MHPRHGLVLLGLIAGAAASGAPPAVAPDRPVTATLRQAFSYDFARRRDSAAGDELAPIAFTMERMIVSDSRFVREATIAIDRTKANALREKFHPVEGGRFASFHLSGLVVDLGLWRHVDLLPNYNAFRPDGATVQVDLARIRF
ncbi:MAG: hypothetical protein JSR48_13275 [Verrucomicrobia bacterium]|nr:hypothetical protein [Verrucomicrobiota bacterium]